MPTFDIKRFADADALKRMQQSHLVALLRPYQAYFAQRGLALDGVELNHELLAHTLLTPDDQLPLDLVTTLYYVNEMATEEGMDALLSAAAAAGVALEGDHVSPADVAAQVWLKSPDLLERKHAERIFTNRRSFEYFQARECPGRELRPSAGALEAMESALDSWFDAKKRGRGCRVFAYPRDGGMSFLIRHGDPFRREGSLKDRKSSSVYYRPERHDVVTYHQALGELRVNADPKAVKDEYRAAFGRYLFGDEEYFPGTSKYTLEPLRQEGKTALACTDVEGIEWVRLTEIRYLWGGSYHETEIRKADDLFAAMEGRGAHIPSRARLIGATFLMKFADAKVPRSVSLYPSNIIKFTRDSDGALVERWLSQRGFILTPGESG